MKKLCLLFVLLATGYCYSQDDGKLLKVSEFSISNITTIEERVFMLHYITDKGYFCFKNNNLHNTIDVYISSDASDELSDFDFFYDNLLYDQLNELSYLDKTQRGELFVEWQQNIDNELYEILYDDFSESIRSGNASCDGALPFYTGNGSYNFPASVNAGNLGSNTSPYYCSGFIRPNGMTTSCLSSTPNPAFYFMRISEPGDLVIYIHSEPQYDIDFDCWGPFYDINTVCDQLSCSNMVDCSFSANATEYCYIDNAQTGQYYMLLITNYSNQECNIIFENLGSGATEPIAKVTLTAGNVWGDDTGYQMLLDADANTLGTIISYAGALSTDCSGNETIYNKFEYKIPTNANGNCSTGNIVLNNSITTVIPAGIYDWCVTNPTPGDRIWIARSGRGNNTEFEVGKAYEFTATMIDDGHDIVNATINNGDIDPCILNVSANPNYGGTVVGGGTFVQGQYCNSIAYANEGYSLFSWTENGLLVATAANYSFPIAESRNFIANFVPAGENKCTLVFDLYDSYGDGWNNSILNVAFNNGLPTQHLTMFSDSSVSYELEVSDGAGITLTWTSGSQWDYECSFVIHYEDGTTIYQGSNLSNSFSHWFEVNCVGTIQPPEVSNDGPYCVGETILLTATANGQAGVTYSWTGPNGFTSNQQNPARPNCTMAMAGTYTCTISVGGATNSASTEVVINPVPIANFNTNSPVYLGNAIQFNNTSTGQNIISYQWDFGDGQSGTGQNTSHIYEQTGNYQATLTIQTSSGCSDQTTKPVTVNPLPSYTINVSATPINGGEPYVGDTPGTTNGSYTEQQSCTVHANPNSGYSFTNWTENGQVVTDAQADYTFTVTGNRTLVAHFNEIIPEYTITVIADPANGGVVSGGGTYPLGATCVLTAYPNAGFVFENWTHNGIEVSTSPTYDFEVTRDATYVAHFMQDTNHCTITAMAEPVEGGAVFGSGTYELGAQCTLSAIPSVGFEFVNWTTQDGNQVSIENSFSFSVTSNAVYVAHFERIVNQYTVTVNVEPAGAGSVIGAGTFDEGDNCTLIAIPNPMYSFVSWTENGIVVDINDHYTFSVDHDRNFVAVFSQGLFYTITASAGANGNISPEGEVMVTPGDDKTFSMIPNSGCQVNKVLVDGVDRGPIPSYTFRNVNENHTIHVEFSGLGVDDNASFDLKVYPNPANEKINIESPNMKRIAVFDMLGVLIESKEVHDEQTTISLKGYSQGTYILKVEYIDESVGYSRFVVVE